MKKNERNYDTLNLMMNNKKGTIFKGIINRIISKNFSSENFVTHHENSFLDSPLIKNSSDHKIKIVNGNEINNKNEQLKSILKIPSKKEPNSKNGSNLLDNEYIQHKKVIKLQKNTKKIQFSPNNNIESDLNSTRMESINETRFGSQRHLKTIKLVNSIIKPTIARESNKSSSSKLFSERILDECLKRTQIKSFKTNSDFNSYLIRNHITNDFSNPVESSINKLRMTEKHYNCGDFFHLKRLNSRQSLNSSISRGSLISEHSNINETSKNENIRGKSGSLNVKNMAEIIANISHDEYGHVDDSHLKKINYKNLRRVIKIREIYKNRFDIPKNENEIYKMPKAFNLELEKMEVREKRILGKPKLIKNKFRLETMNKYKSANGVFFN